MITKIGRTRRFITSGHTSFHRHTGAQKAEPFSLTAHRLSALSGPSGPQRVSQSLAVHPDPAIPCGPVVACRCVRAAAPCNWPLMHPLPCFSGTPSPGEPSNTVCRGPHPCPVSSSPTSCPQTFGVGVASLSVACFPIPPNVPTCQRANVPNVPADRLVQGAAGAFPSMPCSVLADQVPHMFSTAR